MAQKLEKVSIIPVDDEPQSTALTAVTPMHLVDRAVASGASIDVLERLMALQERFEANQARRAFDEAVAGAKSKIPPIARNAKGHNDKRYADFSAIAKVIDPILGEHGLSYRFKTVQAERINVTCILSHKAGHSEETTLAGPADTSGNKNAIQAIGSTLTYLQRYSLVQMLGLAAAQDDDGQSGGSAEKITQAQADNLSDLIEANGKDRAAFLKWAKVARMEDVPVANYEACIKAIEFKAKS